MPDARTGAGETSFAEPQVGIEPTTARLRIECSTPELLWRSRLDYECPGADSNRYAFRHHPLKMACLPISPPGPNNYCELHNHCEVRISLLKTGPTGLEPAT